MDLGATICTPRAPACGICPWRAPCLARAEGIAGSLPRKAPKTPKPVRHGIAWLARREDGAVLLETRPERGLLGGMLGLPGSPWSDAPPEGAEPPFPAAWRTAPGEVRHTFTHFHLVLEVRTARLPRDAQAPVGSFHAGDPGRSLPTVMRKALKLGLAAMARDRD